MSYTARQVITAAVVEIKTIRELQMRALAATAVGYLKLTLWATTPMKDDAAKATVRGLALELGLNKETFEVYGSDARGAALMLAKAPDDKNFLAVRDANDADAALEGMVSLLAAKGVTCPYHLKKWVKAGTGGHLSTEAAPAKGMKADALAALDSVGVNASTIKADAKAAKAAEKADAKATAKALTERAQADAKGAGADILAMLAGITDAAMLNKIAVAVSERMVALQAAALDAAPAPTPVKQAA